MGSEKRNQQFFYSNRMCVGFQKSTLPKTCAFEESCVYKRKTWAYSSGGERYVDIVEVAGSIPATPTRTTCCFYYIYRQIHLPSSKRNNKKWFTYGLCEKELSRKILGQFLGQFLAILQEEEKNSQKPWPLHAIRLLLITGCRLNEILTLKWEEVDPESQCLRLRDSKTGKKTCLSFKRIHRILLTLRTCRL